MDKAVALVLVLLVSSVYGGSWTSCQRDKVINQLVAKRYVDVGVYFSKERCGRYCNHSCRTECGDGRSLLNWACKSWQQWNDPRYHCSCTCVMLCREW